MIGSAGVIRGDARNLPLADDSVDLVVTSPPYYNLRSYEDAGEHYAEQIGAEATPHEYLDSLIDVTRECARVLKSTGSIWVNLGDKYSDRAGPEWAGSSDRLTGRPRKPRRASSTSMAPRKSLLGLPWRYALRCVDDLGLILRAELIWDKPNGMPESITDRVRRSHEQWFHFVLNARYYSGIDEIREQHTMKPQRRSGRPVDMTPRPGQPRQGWSTAGRPEPGVDGHPLGKLPGSVWRIPTQPLKVPTALGVDHFAAFPAEWPKRIIRGWCPDGGTVLDPFGGTGTTAMVASALGRRGISVDMSADYCRLAQWRTNDPAQLAKVLDQPAPKPVDDDQLTWDMLGGVS